jgi:hypothetical protein
MTTTNPQAALIAASSAVLDPTRAHQELLDVAESLLAWLDRKDTDRGSRSLGDMHRISEGVKI